MFYSPAPTRRLTFYCRSPPWYKFLSLSSLPLPFKSKMAAKKMARQNYDLSSSVYTQSKRSIIIRVWSIWYLDLEGSSNGLFPFLASVRNLSKPKGSSSSFSNWTGPSRRWPRSVPANPLSGWNLKNRKVPITWYKNNLWNSRESGRNVTAKPSHLNPLTPLQFHLTKSIQYQPDKWWE